MKKSLRKNLALLLAFLMISSTFIGTLSAFADDEVPVTVTKYWEDLSFSGIGQPGAIPHSFSFEWHDAGNTQSITLDSSNNYSATVFFSNSFLALLNNATDQYGVVSNNHSLSNWELHGTFFDEISIQGYNTSVFIWDKDTNSLRIFNSNADNFFIVHKEWDGIDPTGLSVTFTATDDFGNEGHAATPEINGEGGSTTMTMDSSTGWTLPFFTGVDPAGNWNIVESPSSRWSTTINGPILMQDENGFSYYVYDVVNSEKGDPGDEQNYRYVKIWEDLPDGVTPPDFDITQLDVDGNPIGTVTMHRCIMTRQQARASAIQLFLLQT